MAKAKQRSSFCVEVFGSESHEPVRSRCFASYPAAERFARRQKGAEEAVIREKRNRRTVWWKSIILLRGLRGGSRGACVRVGREPVGCRDTVSAALAFGAKVSKSARGAVQVTQATSKGRRKLIARCSRGRCVVVAGAKGLNGRRK